MPLLLCVVLVGALGALAGQRGNEGAGAGWTQWRGAARDGVVRGFSEPSPWPEKLEKVWSVAVGDGYSSPIAAGSRLYIHSRGDGDEFVSALDFATGNVLWNDSYPAPSVKTPEYAASEGEGPYATPILHSGRLYTVGVNGVASSYDAQTGELLWRRDFSDRIVEIHRFCGTAASPLIVDDLIVIEIGDDDSGEVLALATDTGETRWSWAEAGAGNASPIIVELAGTRQLVTITDQSVVGLDVADGNLLWRHPFPAPRGSCSLNIPTPVVHGNAVIVSALHSGTMAIGVARSGETWTADPIWTNPEIAPQWSSLVVDGDEAFGISHRRSGQLVALDARTGDLHWSTEGRSGENGFVIDTGDTVLFLMNEGELLVARKTRPGLEIEARYEIADAAVWSHPLVTPTGILVRDKSALTLWSFD